MIFAALGFTANAQRGAAYASNSNTSVNQFIYALDLSPSQVRDWNELNRYYEDEFYYVRNDRKLSSRAKTRKLENLYDQRDRDLRKILSKYQYKKFVGLKSYNAYSRPNTYTRPTTTYYRNNNYNTGSRYGNRGNGRNYSCRAY